MSSTLSPVDQKTVTNVPSNPDAFGNSPDVNDELKSTGHVIENVDQAMSVIDRLIEDSRGLIDNSALITKKYNGAPPFNRREMKNKGKDYKRNISTGALATAIDKLPPRFYMPLKTAKYLTAADLLPDRTNSAAKVERFRAYSTRVLRKWKRFHFFNMGLANEIVKMGYCFAVFFDEFEWRPQMVRMDRGFVPAGTEIMDENLPFFLVKWSYQPADLIGIVKKSSEKKVAGWEWQNVANSVNSATVPANSTSPSEVRSFEDTIRQATNFLSYKKGSKEILAYHLFAREVSGKVSHWIISGDGLNEKNLANLDKAEIDKRLLYKKFERFDSMEDVVTPFVFQYGNGTIHGSLGAGHLLYDMSLEVERTRNESFDNLSNTNKIKIQAGDGKNLNDVKMTVNDDKIIVAGGAFPTNPNMPVAVEGYIALDQQQSRLMMERVGAFMPPMAVPGTSPTATETNANIAREQEVSGAMLDNFLTQEALLITAQLRRLYKKGNPDPIAKKTREYMLKVLDEDELEELLESSGSESIASFTTFKQQQNAAFCQSVRGNPYYDQEKLERTISESAVGETITAYIMPPGQDQNIVAEATRQQILENNSLVKGQQVPVVKSDNDFVHMQTLKPAVEAAVAAAGQNQQNLVSAFTMVQHYQAHYDSSVQKKSLPKEAYNPEKRLLASWNQALEAVSQAMQEAARAQAMAPAAGAPALDMAPAPAAGQAVPAAAQGTAPAPEGEQPLKASMSISVKWSELTPQERAVIMNKIGVIELIPSDQPEVFNQQQHLSPPPPPAPAKTPNPAVV